MSKVAGPTEGLHPFRTTQPQSGPRHQATVADVAMVEGFGFWSGKDVRVEFHPAAKDTGYIFVRDDLEAAVRIPGTVDHRIETPRRTTLVRDGAQVEMVEHILAALSGLGITNCEIRVNQSEMPGCRVLVRPARARPAARRPWADWRLPIPPAFPGLVRN